MPMAEPDSAETPQETPLRTPVTGKGKLRVGNPGNKGGGRPPRAFKDAIRAIREKPEVHDAIELAASDPSSKGFNAALRVITDYDEDRPGQKVEHTFNLTPEQRQNRIAELLTTAKARAANGNGHHASNGNGTHG